MGISHMSLFFSRISFQECYLYNSVPKRKANTAVTKAITRATRICVSDIGIATSLLNYELYLILYLLLLISSMFSKQQA